EPSAASAKDDQGLSAVLQAQYRGRSDMVAVLRPAVEDLDVFEASALGETDRVRAVVGADPGLVRGWSPDGFTPLHLAVFFGHLETARELLQRGADLTAVSRNAMTVMPLHSAAAGRNAGSVLVVLE